MCHTCKILDAKYQKSYLSKIVLDSKHERSDEQSMLYYVITYYEFLLDRTIGTWKTNPVNKEL